MQGSACDRLLVQQGACRATGAEGANGPRYHADSGTTVSTELIPRSLDLYEANSNSDDYADSGGESAQVCVGVFLSMADDPSDDRADDRCGEDREAPQARNRESQATVTTGLSDLRETPAIEIRTNADVFQRRSTGGRIALSRRSRLAASRAGLSFTAKAARHQLSESGGRTSLHPDQPLQSSPDSSALARRSQT